MRDFLIKSKDIYFSDREKYSHFADVLSEIQKLSISKNYYNTDLFNIEEILSILEMETFIEGEDFKKEFIKYIIDVIIFYTPKLVPQFGGSLPEDWHHYIFGGEKLSVYYGWFVGNLLNLEFEKITNNDFGWNKTHLYVTRSKESNYQYAVVTLNYDMILENHSSFIKENYKVKEDFSFNTMDVDFEWNKPPLAKLHGSIEDGVLVPPTWAKGNNQKITAAWKLAHKVLRESNHIRFIGYSLPLTDSYIKYLLKSSVLESKHLKTIDVICLDPTGETKSRYDDFIKFDFYQFANADITTYIQQLKHPKFSSEGRLPINTLEQVHKKFMEENKVW